jgi:FMN phosphatase YigB (HAD superfamily)
VVRSVVFDVGETLLDDSREWDAWADWIGVSRHTFSAVLGAVTGAGRDNAETFQYFRPGFDLARERQRREEASRGEHIEEFERVIDLASARTEDIVYVGDHRDNDLLPAKAAGLRVALIRRAGLPVGRRPTGQAATRTGRSTHLSHVVISIELNARAV